MGWRQKEEGEKGEDMRMTLAIACLFSGCAITPDRAHIAVDKVVRLDEPMIEGTRVSARVEWVR